MLAEASAASATAPRPRPAVRAAPPAPSATCADRRQEERRPTASRTPPSVDFTDHAGRSRRRVRRKLGKDAGAISPAADLAQIRSINLATAKTHQIDLVRLPWMSAHRG